MRIIGIMSNIVISGLAFIMCALGIGLCIYLLITKRLDTSLPTSNMLICFFGLGWLSFTMQTFTHMSVGCLLGIMCFFIGFSIWAYKHLKIGDMLYRTLLQKHVKQIK